MVRLVPRVELNILTGFLGSGKTTLLRSFLRGQKPGSVAVIINEYGKVSIDDRLATFVDIQISAIANGCLCCTVLSELREALLQILARRARGELAALERIVIETSGLADPAPIIATVLSDLNLNEYLSLGICTATFDPIDGIDYSKRFAESERQLVCADRVVITKRDLVSPQAITDAAAYVRQSNPLCEIITEQNGDDALFSGLTQMRYPTLPAKASPHIAQNLHTHGMHSFSIIIDEAIDWAAFSIWLTAMLNRHGERILRFKSVLAVTGSNGRLVIHGVRHKVYPPEHLAPTPNDGPQSQLVFITCGIEESEIRRSLVAFLQYANTQAVYEPATASASGRPGAYLGASIRYAGR